MTSIEFSIPIDAWKQSINYSRARAEGDGIATRLVDEIVDIHEDLLTWVVIRYGTGIFLFSPKEDAFLLLFN